MSGCSCQKPRDYRITGEVWNEGSDNVEVRIRCVDCGGKVTTIPGAWLADLPGLELDDIKNGRCLDPEDHREITIDLI